MMVNAIMQTLSQLGITPANTTGAAGTSTDQAAVSNSASPTSTSAVADALRNFMRDLFQSLQAQTGSPGASATDSDGDNDGSSGNSSSTQVQQYASNGPSRFQQDLQTLINSLRTDSNSNNPSNNSQLSTDFQNLLASLGAPGNGTSLTSFLQSLSQQVSGQDQQAKLFAQQA